MTTQVTTVKTEKQLRLAIANIKKNGATLQSMVHTTAIECLQHAKQHGNITMIGELINATPAMVRNKGLAKWLIDHAPLHIKYDSSAKCFVVKAETKNIKGKNFLDDANWKIKEADATPFWEYTLEQEPQAFDLAKMLQAMKAMVKRATNEENMAKLKPEEATIINNIAASLTATVESTNVVDFAKVKQEAAAKGVKVA
jgi:hypothetical protein